MMAVTLWPHNPLRCHTCGRPVVKGKARCSGCLEKAAAGVAGLYEFRLAQNVCRQCAGKLAPTSTRLCRKHLLKQHEHAAKFYLENRERLLATAKAAYPARQRRRKGRCST